MPGLGPGIHVFAAAPGDAFVGTRSPCTLGNRWPSLTSFAAMPALEQVMFARLLRSAFLVVTLASLCALQSSASYAADEPDLIFKRSTVFKWVTPNDKLATYGIDDPEVEGVACHFTVPERGGLTGWIGVAEEVSDISLACRQVGPIHFN
jgi:CreA protein